MTVFIFFAVPRKSGNGDRKSKTDNDATTPKMSSTKQSSKSTTAMPKSVSSSKPNQKPDSNQEIGSRLRQRGKQISNFN